MLDLGILDAVVIPLTIFALGVFIPWTGKAWQRFRLYNLIDRELQEMTPDTEGLSWFRDIDIAFSHRKILQDPSNSADLLLSLPSTHAYELAQLWILFDKALTELEAGESECHVLERYGKEWLGFLGSVCRFLDDRASSPVLWVSRRFEPDSRQPTGRTERRSRTNLIDCVYGPWEQWILGKLASCGDEGKCGPASDAARNAPVERRS